MQPFGTKWHLEVLETFRALAGLPVLVSLFLEVFKPEVKAVGAAVSVGVALILRFFPKLRRMLMPRAGHALWMALPWFSTSVLAFILVFKTIPARSKAEENLLQQKDNLILQKESSLTKAWVDWQVKLEKAASQCSASTSKVDAARDAAKEAPDKSEKEERARSEEASAEKARDQCLSENLGSVLDEKQRPPGGVAGELMAGQLMLANHNANEALWDRLSVDDRFLGEGFSVPRGGNPKLARVPEYLVPNLSDQSPHVWHWEIEEDRLLNKKPVVETNLMYVLHNILPSNHADFEKNWQWMERHLGANDPVPLLVRFAMREGPTSGCLGRSEATRVFMSELGEVSPKSVEAAALSTGYIRDVNSGEKGVKIHIWVFAPSDPDEVVRATWGSVLANFNNWVTQHSCRVANERRSDRN